MRFNFALRDVSIIVPVFNAFEDLLALIRSIAAAQPNSLQHVTYFFSDDASTDPRVKELFAADSFFNRTDVVKLLRTTNGGFVQNVNSAMKHAVSLRQETDFIILNSDTLVFSDFIEHLQSCAYAQPNVASVTPLTNNGTIASLFNWPNGGEIPNFISADQIAKAVKKLNIPAGDALIPTGVGFCMYIVGRAFEQVGYFDEIFGIGYGEECDWCRRAAKLGLKNILSTDLFVAHTGGKSFGNLIKQNRIAENGKILSARYPDYEVEVAAHVYKDPLKFHRILILLEAATSRTETKNVYLFTLHTDLDTVHDGGTEAHVRHVRSLLLEDGHVVVTLAKSRSGNFVLRGMYNGVEFLKENLHPLIIARFLSSIEHFFSHLHVHHAKGWPAEAMDALANSRISTKLVTIHDFWFLCPSINLLSGPDRLQFCHVEKNLDTCNTCLQVNWGYFDESIQNYRNRMLNFLKHFDYLLTPSDSVAPYLAKAFGNEWPQIANKVHVFSHDLSYLESVTKLAETKLTDIEPSLKEQVAFIGAIGDHKGAQLIHESIPRLRNAGFEVVVFGTLAAGFTKRGIKIYPYTSPGELAQLFRSSPGIRYLGFVSLWPETFSYTFFEGILLSNHIIPVVGPYGNPAALTKANNLGPVMNSCSPQDLLNSLLEARSNKPVYLANTANFRKNLSEVTNYQEYLKNYLKFTTDNAMNVSEIAASNIVAAVPTLSLLNFVLNENKSPRSNRDKVILNVIAHSLAIFDRYPRLKNYMFIIAKIIWRALRQSKKLYKKV